jgi:hypothetical protein
MNQFNFNELMRKVADTDDLNAKELLLSEARAICQQTVLCACKGYLMQIESELAHLQKVKELSVPVIPPQAKDDFLQSNLKISTCIVFEMLKLFGMGRSVNDLTTMADLASKITGHSKHSIRKIWQAGFIFSERQHGSDIKEVNAYLQRLGLPIEIDIAKKY